MTKTIIGIGTGMALSAIAITGIYFLDLRHEHPALWTILSLLSWVALAWGVSNFAKYRGYAGSVGCGLAAVGLFIELFIVFRAYNPWAYAVGFLFVTLLPLSVILALPNKARRSRRRPK